MARRIIRSLPALPSGLVLAMAMCALPVHADPPDYEKDVLPLVTRYCMDCHAPPKTKGDLDLSIYGTLDLARQVPAVWYRVQRRVRDRDMPPASSPKPSDAERDLIIGFVDGLKPADPDCQHLATDESKAFYRGYVMSRRLSGLEYQNSVRDLFYGLELDLASSLPADGSGGEGFDNHGDTLFTSPIHVERFLENAGIILGTALPPEGSEFDTAEARRRRELILTAKPGDAGLSGEAAAARVLDRFMRRAYRRPLDPEDVLPMLGLYRFALAEGSDHEDALKFAMKGVLVSPHFLFLAERMPEGGGQHPLSNHALAARLAAFLWSSMPDEQLTALADAGELQNENVLREQVRRMLADPKSRGLAEGFAPQWLGLRSLGGSVRPDPNAFPEYDEALEGSMRREAVGLFDAVFSEGRSLLDLVDSRTVFVDARLASLYGIEGVEGESIREVEVADANRGGVLGLAGVLTVTSHPLRTSPVLRGRWVLEQVLGERIPPPPPNVPALAEDGASHEGLTLRQQMEAHRTNPDCASCHQKMDPIGFGLENFDPIGRWRSDDRGRPIDAAGELPSGEKFASPADLKRVILNQKDKFLENFSRKMLGYALGRSLTDFDKCVITEAMRNLEADDHRATALFETIVLSLPFRNRYYKD